MNKYDTKRLNRFFQKWNKEGIKASLERKKARYLKKTGIANKVLSNRLLAQPLPEYLEERFDSASREKVRSESYTAKAKQPVHIDNLPAKVIAFYLPQFHPIPENDKWWGEGFTEWTNVTKAQPQFLNHYQPHLPGEMGFYDLRLPETLKKQAALAKHYGVQGFCFHYYWFNGKRLLEKPLEILLENKDIDIEFCYCWANENWTKAWDGLENEVLVKQDYSAEDDIAFIRSMLEAFKDRRYIRIENKPVLIIYRALKFPDIVATINRWRAFMKSEGFDGIYLICAESLESINASTYGFDAAVEFPPHQSEPKDVTSTLKVVNPNYEGVAFDYSTLPDTFGKKDSDEYELFKTVMPSWDNEARKPGKGISYVNSSPQTFSKWVDNALDITLKKEPSKRLLFVNAWNEWAEGAHLEPDLKYGYAYLHTLAAHLMNRSKNDTLLKKIAEHNSTFKPCQDGVIVYHSYYDELIEEVIGGPIRAHQNVYNVIITIRPDTTTKTLADILRLVPAAMIIVADNRGRDVKPFLKALKIVHKYGFKYVCKIHSKKSPHHVSGDETRQLLINSLLPSPELTPLFLESFKKNRNLNVLAPAKSLINCGYFEYYAGNIEWLTTLYKELNIPQDNFDFVFPRGTMFWARVDSLKPLMDETIFNLDRFEAELGQLDGTFAHAIERMIGILAVQNNGEIQEVPLNNTIDSTHAKDVVYFA